MKIYFQTLNHGKKTVFLNITELAVGVNQLFNETAAYVTNEFFTHINLKPPPVFAEMVKAI